MSRVKCSCGEEKVFVDTTNECDKCEHNGFALDPETAKELGVEEKCQYYDERLRTDAERLTGREIVRYECSDNGECNMGSNWNAGCSLYTCSKCSKHIDFVAFVDGC